MDKVIQEAEKLNSEYNLFITINSNSTGKIPITIKDSICTEGIKTTSGSKILDTYIPPFDATVIKKVKEKGFYIVGKNTQDAFGFGSFSTNCAYGIPKNPYDKERSCGGSSGGTAAYVKLSEYCRYGLGVSTGGSINCPASFCGVVGLTPTYGLVSRYGLIDHGSSLDKIGPIAKTVKDAAELLTLIAGYDEKDPTSAKRPKENYSTYCNNNIKGLKIAVIKEAFGEGVDKEVSGEVRKAVKKLEELGAKVEEISFPIMKYSLPVYYIIAMAEASTNLARYCGLRYGSSLNLEGNYNEYFSKVRDEFFEEEPKRRILLGTFIRMVGFRDKYYMKALAIRKMIINEYKMLFTKYDAIITPTMPILPPKFSEIKKLTPVQNYMMDILTVPPNLAGLPCLSVPCGGVNGLPVGMQIISDHFREDIIIMVGANYERT